MPQIIPFVVTAITTVTSAVVAAGPLAVAAFNAANIIGAAALANAAFGVVQPEVKSSSTAIEWNADPNAPNRFAFGRVGGAGNIIHNATYGPDKMYVSFVGVMSASGPIKGWVGFRADELPVAFDANGRATTAEYAGEMFLRRQRGLQPEPAALASPSGLKNGATMPGWGASYKLSGKAAFMYTLAENSKRSAFQGKVPTPINTIEGLFCYDPRFDSTYPGGSGPCRLNDPTTWVYSVNAYIHALSWAIGRWEGLTAGAAGAPYASMKVGGIGARPDGIDMASYVEAANVFDERAWACSAWPDADQSKAAILDSFLQAGGGIYAERQGRISCMHRAAPRASIATITADDTAGTIEYDTTTSLLERINTIRPEYWSEAHDWQMVATDEVTADSWREEDGQGVAVTKSKGQAYNYVPGSKQVRELAALQIGHTREGIKGVAPLRHYLDLEVGDCFTFEVPEAVLNGQKCIVLNVDPDLENDIINVTFCSETDGKYPFAFGQADAPPPAPAIVPRDLTFVSPPAAGDWTITPRPPSQGGAQQPGFDLTGFVSNETATAIIVETGPSATGPWKQAYQGPPTVTNIPIDGLQPGAIYFIAIQYQRNQNYSEREVFGPFTAPELIAGDLSPESPVRIAVTEITDRLQGVEQVSAANAAAVADLQDVYGTTVSVAASAAQVAADKAAVILAKADTLQAKSDTVAAAGAAATNASQAGGFKNDAQASAAASQAFSLSASTSAARSPSDAPGLNPSAFSIDQFETLVPTVDLAAWVSTNPAVASYEQGGLRLQNVPAPAAIHVHAKAATARTPGRRFRVSTTVRRLVDGGSATENLVDLYCWAWDAAGNVVTAGYLGSVNPTVAAGSQTITADILTLPDSAVWVRAMARVFTNAGATLVLSIKTEDIEAQLASRDSANASLVSAANASASEDAAGQQAAASQADRVRAEAARTGAEAAETRTATSESNAAGSAALAAQQAGLSAGSANLSGQRADAAAGSAQLASTKADEAGVAAAASAASQVVATAEREAATAAREGAEASQTVADQRATAAATSAANAAASETAAGQKAAAAEGSATVAGTRAGEAQAFRDQSAVSEANAAGHALTAQQASGTSVAAKNDSVDAKNAAEAAAATSIAQASSAGASAASAQINANLAASVGAESSVINNGRFIQWPSGQVRPTGWDDWANCNSAPNIQSGYGWNGRRVVRMNYQPSMGDQGIVQDIDGFRGTAEPYNLEVEVAIPNGGATGTGFYGAMVLMQCMDASGSYVGDADGQPKLWLEKDINGNVAGAGIGDGKIYRFKKRVNLAPGTFKVRVYLMSRWTLIGPPGANEAKTLDWYSVSLTPMSAAESSVDGLAAQLSITARVAADTQTRLASVSFSVTGGAGGDPFDISFKAGPNGSDASMTATKVRLRNVINGQVVDALTVADGKAKFWGDVAITGGTFNVNNRFLVAADGGVTIRSSTGDSRLEQTSAAIKAFNAGVKRAQFGDLSA
ncbi:hypothetical protein [uncultured Brevundimonas sp.]|uniref:hypothetical protein n=1 Tax=uncultured Brevundimonas sp. TaxID=213418 RepID=UPI0025DAD512|nr:hypothetical protein [uncultured Brevundimonas sp.]